MRFLPKKFIFIIIGLLISGGLLLYSQNARSPASHNINRVHPVKSDTVPTASEQVGAAKPQFSRVKINDVVINVEIAKTLEQKARGLSERDFLDKDQGMLFIYNTPGFYSFWMRDMKFPLDIIWIDKNYQIVDIDKNILPDSYPNRFQPQAPVQYVLEVNAGFCEKHNIEIGDFVDFL